VSTSLDGAPGVVVAASDYVKLLPNGIDHHIAQPVIALGTDGFGRSESREALRDHFEVDARHVVAATLSVLAREKQIDVKVVQAAFKYLGIDPEKPNPAHA
jgi:pyruvate dehydrogenase E1 component